MLCLFIAVNPNNIALRDSFIYYCKEFNLELIIKKFMDNSNLFIFGDKMLVTMIRQRATF
jgi:hypothetical protein